MLMYVFIIYGRGLYVLQVAPFDLWVWFKIYGCGAYVHGRGWYFIVVFHIFMALDNMFMSVVHVLWLWFYVYGCGLYFMVVVGILWIWFICDYGCGLDFMFDVHLFKCFSS